MRVALLPSAFWPALGGVEELTRRLADALGEAGDTVEIWAPLDPVNPAERKETWCGLSVRRFAMPLPPARFATAARSLPTMVATTWELRRAVAEFGPDVLHVQCFGPNGAYATVVSALARIPLVVTLQGETVMDDHDIYEHSALLRSAFRLGVRRAGQVTGCSAFTVEDGRRFGLKANKGLVIFNGVRLDEQPGQDSAGAPPVSVPFERYVLALGRVVDKKGFDLLIRAFAEDDVPEELGLVIGGSGPASGKLEELATNLGLSGRVCFPGRLSRRAVSELMQGAEVFVMPSRLEPFGIVLLEAWRDGAAVVATTHGGPPEFVEEGVTGLLADPLDTKALACAIAKLARDPDGRAAMVNAARQKVQEFSWMSIAEQYRQVYRSLVGGVA